MRISTLSGAAALAALVSACGSQSPDAARREWQAPAAAVKMLLNAWAPAIGQPAYITNTVAEITGERARTFRDWATDHAERFRA